MILTESDDLHLRRLKEIDSNVFGNRIIKPGVCFYNSYIIMLQIELGFGAKQNFISIFVSAFGILLVFIFFLL